MSAGSSIIGEIIAEIVIELVPSLWDSFRTGVSWCWRKIAPSPSDIMLRGVDKGNINIVRAALSKGARINAFNGEALCRAARKGDEPMVDFLLDQPGINVHGIGRDGKKLGFTSDRALYEATKGGFNKVAKKLKAHGASEEMSQAKAPRGPIKRALTKAARRFKNQ